MFTTATEGVDGSARTRRAAALGFGAAACVVGRIGWECIQPIHFDAVKTAMYVRDAITLGPAAFLGVAAITSLPRRTGRAPASRRVAIAMAVFASCLCAGIARFGLLGIPHIADEASYLWLGELFEHGHLSALPSAYPANTLIEFVADIDGRRISAFFPGSSLALAIGFAVGAPWLVNPLLAGLVVIVTYWSGKRLFDERTAILAAALMALSPFLFFQGASYFSHVWTALLTVPAFTLAVAPTRRWDSAACGALAAAALLSRPVSAAILAFTIAIFWLAQSGLRNTVLSAIKAVAGSLPFVVLFFAYNRALTGKFGTTTHTLILPGESVQLNLNAVKNAVLNLAGLSVDISGLPLLALLFAIPALRARNPRLIIAIIGYASLQLGAYAIYRYHGISYGPRFLFEVAPLLLLVVAYGAVHCALLKGKVVALVGLAGVLAVVGILPTRLAVFHSRAEYLRLPKVTGRALVFMAPGRYQDPDTFYPAFVSNGEVVGSTRVVYVRDSPPDRCAIRASFPGRAVYQWEADSRTLRSLDEQLALCPPHTAWAPGAPK